MAWNSFPYFIYGIQRAAQTVLGVYLERTSTRDTSASSALGVLNEYALYKSTHSLTHQIKKLVGRKRLCKGSPYSITERRVPELIPVLGSQSAGDVSHKHGGRLPLLSATPAVTIATLKRAATNFAAW